MDIEAICKRIRKAYTASIDWIAAPTTNDVDGNSPYEDKQVRKCADDLSIIGLLEHNPLRIAAYCRCDEEELPVQVTSAELQRHFLEGRIRRVPSWTCVGSFIDQCPKSTSLKKRPAFKKMVDNSDRYDLVLCRSISSLGSKLEGKNGIAAQLQELSKRGIYFFFECERLYTGDASWKLTWMLLSTMARQECRCSRRNVSMKIPPEKMEIKRSRSRQYSNRKVNKPIKGE